MATIEVGDAAPGWPTTGAARQGDGWVITSRNLPSLELAVVDATGRATAQLGLGDGDGAWGVAVEGDATYLGLYGTDGANLLRVVDGRREPIARLATTFIWDLALAGDGQVIGVGTGPALAFAWDPATGLARDLDLIGPDEQPRTCQVVTDRIAIGGATSGGAFLSVGGAGALPAALRGDDGVYSSAVTGDGRLVVGTTGPGRRNPAVAVIDLAEPRAATVVRLPGEGLVDAVATGDDATWATARPSGALYRITGGTVTRVAVPVALSETRALAVDEAGVHGVAADGSTWTHDPGSGRTDVVSSQAAGVRPGAQRVQTLVATDDRVDVAGTFTATRHHPAARTATTRAAPGEAKAMVVVDGTTHLAMYPVAEIWTWPADADAPGPLARLRPDQIRPLDMVWVQAAGRLAVSTTDDAGTSVLHLVDPATGDVAEVADPLDGGGLAGLAVDGATVLVGGSGTVSGIGAVDALSGQVRWVLRDVLPGGGFAIGLQVVEGRLVVTSTRGWAVGVDLISRAVGPAVQLAPTAGRLRREGGRLLLATGDAVLAVDATTLQAEVIEDGLQGAFWGWPSLAVAPDGTTWVVAGRRLARLVSRGSVPPPPVPAPTDPEPS